jgi:hypothetical protein
MALIGLWNLDRLPIAWNDEVQNLDPAMVWHNTGTFCSPLWPNPGAEIKFLSYPPLIEAWHCLWLFFGKSVWIVRLPFLLAHLTTAWLLYRGLSRLLKHQDNFTFWAFLLTALFLFDKATGEIARSLRVETPILLLLATLLNLLPHYFQEQTPKRALIIGFILGGLVLAHLYTWPLVITTLVLCGLNAQKSHQTNFIMVLACLLPIGLFWMVLSPEIQDLKTQMFMQAHDHSSHSLTQNIYDFFIGRFIPYSLEQPYTPVLHILYFLLSFQLLFHYKRSFSHTATALTKAWIPLLFLSVSLPMMLFIDPQHRYYPIQHFLGLLVVADAVVCLGIHRKIEKWLLPIRKKSNTRYNHSSRARRGLTTAATLLLAFVVAFPYTIRHSAAALQRAQRNPNTAIQFLNQNLNHLPAGEILGEPIANYWLAQSPHPKNWRYGFEFYPQHFPFNPKLPRFFLSRTSPNQLPFLKIIDHLQIPPSNIQEKTNWLQGGHTYNGLYLYQIPSEDAWRALTNPEVLKVTSGH